MRQTSPELIGLPLSAKVALASSVTGLTGVGGGALVRAGAGAVWARASIGTPKEPIKPRSVAIEKSCFKVQAIVEQASLLDGSLHGSHGRNVVLHEIGGGGDQIFQRGRTEMEL